VIPLDTYTKRTWAVINLDALKHNLNVVKEMVAGKSKIMAVVKADAYGHGAVPIALRLESLGVDYFAVADLDEAMQLRKGGITTPILILGYTSKDLAGLLTEYNITQTVFSLDYAEGLSKVAEAIGCKLKVHIKLDTGMNRLGFPCQTEESINSTIDLLVKACKLPNLEVEGIFTHFAVSDEPDNPFTLEQLGRFKSVIKLLEQKGIKFLLKHCANSGAVLSFPETYMDMVRPGIMLYGLNPSRLCTCPSLQPVMELKSVIVSVKDLDQDQTVSYGRTFKADTKKKVAAIPLGYADGYPTSMSNKGVVIVKGKKYPIAGRVCMDQLIIDATKGDLNPGDIVTIIGSENGETISADDIANIQGRLNYEVVCSVAKRVPRIYIEGGKQVSALNYLI